MSSVLALSTDAATLRLLPQSDGWTKVTLEIAGGTHVLGADAHGKVMMRLAAGLASPLAGKPIAEIKGVPVRVVMSLFEEHCTIFAGDVGDVRRWLVQSPDGALIATFDLSPVDRERWLADVSAAQPAQGR